MNDLKKTVQQLRDDMKYPATKVDLVAKCRTWREFSPMEKAWLATHLPEGTYISADEVIRALNLNVPTEPVVDLDSYTI